MKIEDLKLFVKVVELGSFTAAANALDVPRANVSRRINELEAQLHTSLFHRTTRSLSLTNHGEIYYQEILQALALFDNANQAITQADTLIKGKIKLGILSETHELLQPILFTFLDLHPEVELDVRVIQNGFIDMYQQGLDIAFHGGELIDSDLIARQILPLDRCLVASPKYLQSKQLPEDVHQLVEHTALCFRWPSGEIDDLWQFVEGEVKVNSPLVSNSIAFLKDATLSGRGIAFLPKILVEKELENGELYQILPEVSAKTEHGYLLYPQPRTLNYASRELIQYLIQEIPKLA
ncbi:transcriptional regulator [Vibrio ponticus]|uniref:Transcriptional regulator n=1 Tax=Vibrio ponticus TaxID=265668 RepID=A0ABX3FH25_9VIBR|nr:LysR family transcriptional regulator [Vibrio ponticus]OLQ90814.1 transcriptional regulator [Vibrio ponticus]